AGDQRVRVDAVIVAVLVVLNYQIAVAVAREVRKRAVRLSRLIAHAVVAPVGPAACELGRHVVGVGDGGGAVAGHDDLDGQVLVGAGGAGQLGVVLGGSHAGDRQRGDQADGSTADHARDPHS